MSFDDLIVERAPSTGAQLDRPYRHFYEGAVMPACVVHLFETEPVRDVRIPKVSMRSSSTS